MFLWAAILAFILVVWFHHRINLLEKSGRKDQLSYYFYRNSVEVLLSFLVVTLAYGVLLVVAIYFSDSFSVRSLVGLEKTLEHIKASFSRLKLGPVGVFVVLLALFGLGMLRFPAEKSKRLRDGFEKYKMVTRRIYILLALLCSFTLFGSLPGDPTSHLRLQIKSVRDGYASLREEVRKSIAQRVADDLVQKTVEALPPSYQGALASAGPVEQSAALRDRYAWAKAEYGLSNDKAGRIVALAGERPAQATRKRSDTEASTRSASKPAEESVPEEASFDKVQSARNLFHRQAPPTLSKMRALLKMPGAKEVIAQIPKILTGGAKQVLARELIAEYPILEPLLDSLVKTADDAFEKRLGDKVERVARSLAKDPSSSGGAAEEASAGLVRDAKIAITPEIAKAAEDRAQEFQESLAAVKEASADLESGIRRAEEKRIDRWIADLRSPKEEVREKAVGELVKRSDNMSRAHVEKLRRLARGGGPEWSKHLSREGHCDWYEKTSARYYAGTVLTQVKNPYMTDAILREAENARDKGKDTYKVTDPGWI
ncbi:MAG TPA: hypothetical protein VGM86_24690 [Thermoanaerobaculia bacterium]